MAPQVAQLQHNSCCVEFFACFARAFFRGPELCCSCAASLHFVLQNISSWECSRLAFARPVSMLLTYMYHDFSSFGVGRRTCLARDTNVGFRQMMQFWNPLIMRYHACDKALPVSLLLERRVDFYIWVLKGPPTKMCDAAARPCAATQSLTVARLQHKLQHKAATQIWGLCTYVAT